MQPELSSDARAPVAVLILMGLLLGCGQGTLPSAPAPLPGIAKIVEVGPGGELLRHGDSTRSAAAIDTPLHAGDRIRGHVTFRYANGEDVQVRQGGIVQVADSSGPPSSQNAASEHSGVAAAEGRSLEVR